MTERQRRELTEAEIDALYEAFQTPAHVIAHCRAVSRVAVCIGEALNRCGYAMDIPLIRGAGLAHDAARTQEKHWEVTADALDARGFHREAAIIRVHMRYDFHPFDRLDETDLVCLADRLVKEDHYVGLDERIEYILQKAPDDPEIRARILEKKEQTRQLMRQIETAIGRSIDAVAGEE